MLAIQIVILFSFSIAISAFTPSKNGLLLYKRNHHHNRSPLYSESDLIAEDSQVEIREDGESLQTDIKPCFYQNTDGHWKQRTLLDDLKPGQLLIGKKIGSSDLLEAKTGPKVFFECGVGRIDKKGNWQIVNAMFRVSKSFSKPSVVKKKVGKLSGKPVELYVRKVYLDTCQLEVMRSMELVEEDLEKEKEREKIISASKLQVGDELIGKVVTLKPYGCIVDVGANRNGLLHIQKVADLFGKYIDKEEGLADAGLERGAAIKVTVKSNTKKRLFLDFTNETKEIAESEQKAEVKAAAQKLAKEEEERESREKAEQIAAAAAEAAEEEDEEDDQHSVSADEADAWAAYGADDFDDGHDDDEDADIEDALGIGSY